MTLETVKDRILEKIGDLIARVDDEQVDAMELSNGWANVYSVLCHADTQDKMTDAAVHGSGNPFEKFGEE